MREIRNDEDGTHLFAETRPSMVHPSKADKLVLEFTQITGIGTADTEHLIALGLDPAALLEATKRQPGFECWGLRAGETCYRTYHTDGLTSRTCPVVKVRAVAKDLEFLLDRCLPEDVDWRTDGQPLGMRLFRSFKHKPDVFVLRDKQRHSLELAVKEARAIGQDPRRHSSIWHGTTGLGKTHLQLAAFFTALEAGYRLVFTNDLELVRIIEGLRSFDEGLRKAAEAKKDLLLRAEAIFYNDLATDTPDRERPGRPWLANLLLEVLEYGAGRIHVTSNLAPAQFLDNKDTGPRVASRMLAAHRGRAPSVLLFAGEDQRTSWM